MSTPLKEKYHGKKLTTDGHGMREIKFRVYTPDVGMSRTFNLWESHKMALSAVNNHKLQTGKFLDGVPNVMQYTGLKDKNGVEIYEGDMVQHSNITKALIVSIGGYIETYSEGHIANGIHIHTKAEDVVLGVSAFNSDREIEVIGNIYQNPELLK